MINYILKTLQQEDHVFIERLGAFRTQLCHAAIEGDVVQPPHYEVVFSQTDSEENNFALADQISRDKQCLFTEANEQITAWVDQLLSALQHNKSVTYEDFGTFMLDKKGSISFESAYVPQLNGLFEGMESIELKQMHAIPVVAEPEPEPIVEPEQEIVEPEPIVESEPIPEPVVEPEPVGANNDSPNNDSPNNDSPNNDSPDDEDVDDDEDEDEDDDDEEEYDDDEEPKKKKRHLAWLWILLLLLAVLAALGFVFKDKLLNYYHEWKEKKQPVEQVIEPVENPNENSQPDMIEETAFVETEAVETAEEPEPEVFMPEVVKHSSDGNYDYIRFEKGHYYAIAGSFPNESDVLRHIRQKKLDQYSPKILIQDGVKNLRVCIGVFDTEEEAESFAKGVNSSYWVLK